MCSVVVGTGADDGELVELERQICELAADLAAATCRWLELIARFDAGGGWAQWGVKSCAHWLSWRLGISLRTGREHVRVARALGALPLVTRHFRTGELSYSKVRAITRVAQPETETQLVEYGLHATGSQLDEIVRGYLGVIRATREAAQTAEEKQYLTYGWDDAGMLRLEGRLTPEVGTLLLQALESAEVEGSPATASGRRAQALAAVVSGSPAPTAELVVHVDALTLPSERIEDRCELERGPVIAPETARRLGCDGTLAMIVEQDGAPLSVGRRTRVIHPRMRRALQARDRGCRFPGCTHARYLHAHHVRHWAHGGSTDLSNLIQLCSEHHQMVHEGGFTVELDARGDPVFHNRYGWRVPGVALAVPSRNPPVGWQNRRAGIAVDAGTARPRSAGDRCDYDIAVMGLASQWLPGSAAEDP